MPGIDESLPFHPLKIAVLTVSDTRTAETDTSGGLLASRLVEAGHELVARAIVKDDVDAIRARVRARIDDPDVEIVLSTGGTGFTPRDVTPEAVMPLLRRVMDGFSAVFHQVSMGTIGVSTLQSRAFAGQAGDSGHSMLGQREGRGRRATASFSACPVPPAPVATPGTWCCAMSSTAATVPVRLPGNCRG